MFLNHDQLADAPPPVQQLFRLAEAALDSAGQMTQASLDATREVVEAGSASLLLTDAWGIWPRDALALQAERRQRAVHKLTAHYRSLLGIREMQAAPVAALEDVSSGSGDMLAALQAVWLETASAFGSLQYCPVVRQGGKSTS